MKEILSTLIIFIIIIFIGLTLYVFEVFPFNAGGPFIEEKKEQIEDRISESNIPDFLESNTDEKVERTKSYPEHMKRGQLLSDQKYYTLAIAEFETAHKLSPSNPAPLTQIGIINYNLKDYVKAKLNFQEVLKLNPNNLTATSYIIKILIAEKKLNEAKEKLDEIDIHNQETKFLQAVLSGYKKDYEQSKNQLHEVIGMNTESQIAIYAKDFLSSYDEFNSNQGGENIHLTTLLSKSAVNSEQYDIAIQMLFEVLKQKKNYRDAWIILGYAYLNQEKFNDAVDALLEAQKLDPQNPQTTFFLGIGYYGLKNMEKAVEALEIAKKNGYEPVVQINQKLAEIYLQMKEYEKSAENYEAVVNLYNQDVYYYVRPISLYIDKLDKPEKALALAEKAIQAHPNEAMSYNLLGWASISMNKLEEAQMLLDKAYHLDPNLDAIHLNYGILSEYQKNNSSALDYYSKAYELGNGNSISNIASERYNNIIKESENYSSILKANLLNQ